MAKGMEQDTPQENAKVWPLGSPGMIGGVRAAKPTMELANLVLDAAGKFANNGYRKQAELLALHLINVVKSGVCDPSAATRYKSD